MSLPRTGSRPAFPGGAERSLPLIEKNSAASVKNQDSGTTAIAAAIERQATQHRRSTPGRQDGEIEGNGLPADQFSAFTNADSALIHSWSTAGALHGDHKTSGPNELALPVSLRSMTAARPTAASASSGEQSGSSNGAPTAKCCQVLPPPLAPNAVSLLIINFAVVHAHKIDLINACVVRLEAGKCSRADHQRQDHTMSRATVAAGRVHVGCLPAINKAPSPSCVPAL